MKENEEYKKAVEMTDSIVDKIREIDDYLEKHGGAFLAIGAIDLPGSNRYTSIGAAKGKAIDLFRAIFGFLEENPDLLEVFKIVIDEYERQKNKDKDENAD